MQSFLSRWSSGQGLVSLSSPSWNIESVTEIVTWLSTVGSSVMCPVLFFLSGFYHVARELVGLLVMTLLK